MQPSCSDKPQPTATDAAVKICAVPGCPALVNGQGSYCREHIRQRHRQDRARRGGREQQGYGWAWRQLSRAVLARDGYTCRYCSGPATTVDHVIPQSRGGSDDPGNLVAACRRCNSAKGDREIKS